MHAYLRLHVVGLAALPAGEIKRKNRTQVRTKEDLYNIEHTVKHVRLPLIFRGHMFA
jgi:hypothetical protein